MALFSLAGDTARASMRVVCCVYEMAIAIENAAK